MGARLQELAATNGELTEVNNRLVPPRPERPDNYERPSPTWSAEAWPRLRPHSRWFGSTRSASVEWPSS